MPLRLLGLNRGKKLQEKSFVGRDVGVNAITRLTCLRGQQQSLDNPHTHRLTQGKLYVVPLHRAGRAQSLVLLLQRISSKKMLHSLEPELKRKKKRLQQMQVITNPLIKVLCVWVGVMGGGSGEGLRKKVKPSKCVNNSI